MQSQRIKLLASMASIKPAGRTQSLASTRTPRSTLRVETPFTSRCPNFRRPLLFDRIRQAGIWGNDHIMMWNTNSDQVAEILLQWIEKHVEKKRK
jgi:hypothetical protein